MNQQGNLTAKELIATSSVEELHRILGMYGEIKNAKSAAQAIVMARSSQPIETIQDLKNVLQGIAPRGKEFKYFAQIFQALRIVVNEEMAVLEEFLQQVPDLLTPKGRLVVMSYHSLEDRPVKNFIRSGKFSGEVEKDFFGNEILNYIGGSIRWFFGTIYSKLMKKEKFNELRKLYVHPLAILRHTQPSYWWDEIWRKQPSSHMKEMGRLGFNN